MTRRLLAFLPVLGLAACLGEPSSAPSEPTQGPAFAISDAFHSSGNPDFAWRPPIASNSSLPAGTFNPNLQPRVRICAWNGTECVGSDVLNLPNTPVVAGQYQRDWTVPVDPTVVYRIFVEVAGTPNPVVIGFADVKTGTTKSLKGTDPNVFVPAPDGSSLPIKFRINTRCTGTCSDGYIDRDEGGFVYYREGGNIVGGIFIPGQDGGGVVTVKITRCPVGEIVADLPKFGPCLNVQTFPEISGDNALDLDNPGIAFVCDPLAAGGPAEGQEELVTLHRKHGTDPIQALPHGQDDCDGDGELGAPVVITHASFKGLFRALVHGQWRTAGRQLAGLVGPKPVYARRLDAGAGGETPDFSFFQFMLPAKMECWTGCVQSASEPEAIVVRVTDLYDNPVQYATVHFSTSDGLVAPLSVPSDADGLASSTWTLPGSGTLWHALASGLGIADPENNGPRTDQNKDCSEGQDCFFDPFMAIQSQFNPHFDDVPDPLVPADLSTGNVTFCAQSSSSGCFSVDLRVKASDLQVGPLPAKPAAKVKRPIH